ncbi:c-type cytochrome [Terriglobus tenax]|uniref:c-type cytochrome n=1 Tax=Terriglobus tenax TaxID=1111115 RepID=UPI0021E01F97|nr:cytochrome c [Terriglobus tenax]
MAIQKTSIPLAAAVVAAVLLGCRHLKPPVPLEKLNEQQTHGYWVFQSNCRQCHSDRESKALQGPSLLGVYQKQYLPSGAAATDERIQATILHGRNMMPAMGGNVSDKDMADLLVYLHTL